MLITHNRRIEERGVANEDEITGGTTNGTEKSEAAAGPNDWCFQHHAAIDAEAAAAANWAAATKTKQSI